MEKRNTVNWFEIPVLDFDRAKGFFTKIFQLGEMHEMDMMGCRMGFFPSEGLNNSGAIIAHEEYEPSAKGVAIYFDVPNDLNIVLNRIEEAGGRIIVPKTQLPDEIGYFAMFLDTEGNRLALHSEN